MALVPGVFETTNFKIEKRRYDFNSANAKKIAIIILVQETEVLVGGTYRRNRNFFSSQYDK